MCRAVFQRAFERVYILRFGGQQNMKMYTNFKPTTSPQFFQRITFDVYISEKCVQILCDIMIVAVKTTLSVGVTHSRAMYTPS
jgi:hypothetical protein